ncbi:spondin domain-containing protein [Pseudoalteromonas sp. SWXJZ94C]|uniref:spondin domain-containing protein n=1 Tax=unclassified Pseudoalteromonas TaxID=194690 RepID=UPI00041C329E|nr:MULTISPECIES: spondin domain-containing protein [unclassified Pseudoalteromonas]MBH0057140.1 spondin domain-containing protein [Pseudoalteromonas sp. SWXJZ94C]
MKASTFTIATILAAASQSTMAAELDLKITNLTKGMHFTPVLITAHNTEDKLFEVATEASSALQAMAEGGDIAALMAQATAAGSDIAANPAGGLLTPATSAMTTLTTTDGNDYLSVTAMLLPTNDAFAGLDSWKIPTEAGTYTVYLNAYDAGTEQNNELVVEGSGAPGVPGIPAAPGGDAGTGGAGIVSNDTNINVHIHPGNLGDDDLTAGNSDVSNTVHRWLNPVAKLTVTVK